MFGSLGFGEIVVIAIVALIFIGPEKLPKVARSVGKSLADLRRVSNELRHEFMSGVEEEERPAAKTGAPYSPPVHPRVRPANGNLASRSDPLTDENAGASPAEDAAPEAPAPAAADASPAAPAAPDGASAPEKAAP